MDEQQLQQMLEQVPPEVVLAIIEMVETASPEQIQQLKQLLMEAIQGGQQGAPEQQQGIPEGQQSVGNEQLFGSEY